MAIYKPPKPRWPAAVAALVAGLAVGFAVGLAIGAEDPDPTEAAREVRASLVTAAGSLEVAGIEYEESVANGEVTKEAEYNASLDHVAGSRRTFEDVLPALELLAPETADRITALYEALEAEMEQLADPGEIDGALATLMGELKGD